MDASAEPRAHLVIHEQALGDIARVLGRLLQETGAGHVLLLDKTGQLISTHGQDDAQDLTGLGALLAGAFASSREIAAMLGEHDFRNILQQGVHESIYSSLIGERWLLVVVFQRQTQVGLVTVLTRRVIEELDRVLQQVLAAGGQTDEPVITVEFRDSAKSAIDALLQD